MTSQPDDLRKVILSFSLGEFFGWDLLLAVGFGAAGGWLGAQHFETASLAAGTVANLVGLVVGAVIGAVAIVAAFLSPTLLSKLALLGRDPVSYLGPFLFTAVLGIAAAFATIGLAATPLTAPDGVHLTVTALCGFFTAWTLGSLVRSLDTLVQFVRLQAEAAQVSEDDVTAFKQRDAS